MNTLKVGDSVIVTPKKDDNFNHSFSWTIKAITFPKKFVDVEDMEWNVFRVDFDQVEKE